jgi:hypothetical protein
MCLASMVRSLMAALGQHDNFKFMLLERERKILGKIFGSEAVDGVLAAPILCSSSAPPSSMPSWPPSLHMSWYSILIYSDPISTTP